MKSAFTTFAILGILLTATSCNYPSAGLSNLFHVYLTWQSEDTSRTMTVVFHHTDHSFADAKVYYDKQSHQGKVSEYRLSKEAKSVVIPELNRHIYSTELRELEPDTVYYFVAGDEANGFSPERKFRTLPVGHASVRFVTGGDMGLGTEMKRLLDAAARTSPHFGLVGGDVVYGNPLDLSRWDSWLKEWEDRMITPEGYSIPMVLAVGNHDVANSFGLPSAQTFFYPLFQQNGETSYFSRRFADDMAVLVLDSGHLARHDGMQASWLAEEFTRIQGLKNKFAIYHVPLYPSHRSFGTSGSVAGRTHWAPLFDIFGLTVAFENHDHAMKRTKRIFADAVAEDRGTVYLGDGCWGQWPRPVDDRWYLEKAQSVQHFWAVEAGAGGSEFRAIDADEGVLDRWSAASK